MAQDWALAYRQFSNDYVAREGEAQEARLGMWREPWDWRREDRLVAAPAASRVEPTARPANDNAAGQCQIKGNISSLKSFPPDLNQSPAVARSRSLSRLAGVGFRFSPGFGRGMQASFMAC